MDGNTDGRTDGRKESRMNEDPDGRTDITLRPGHTARTLLERSLSGGEKGQNFRNAHHRAQNGNQNRKHRRCLSGVPLRPALL